MLSDCGVACCVVMSRAAFCSTTCLGIGSPASEEGMLSDCEIDCLFVVSGTAFHLTTRPGIGSLDFSGKVCSLIVGSVVVLW